MENANQDVLARLHLGAMLPLLEDVAQFDDGVREATKNWNLTLQFQLPGGDPATALCFGPAGLKTHRGGVKGPKVTLTFPNARLLNDVFQGRIKKSPRPNLRGLFHLKKLMGLDPVLGKLEYYLRPSADLLQIPETFAFCVRLNLYALAFGIQVLGEHDPEMKPVVSHLPDGVLEIRIAEGPSAHIAVRQGRFIPGRGPAEKANAIMDFDGLETAWALLQGNLDLYAAVGGEKLRIRGNIPLLDGITPLLDQLSLYFS
ncbi:MAG: hypothetical protein FJ152_07980 [Firmicutes bacterium]|nr:hypothetical protein [Bacillota bacterium]